MALLGSIGIIVAHADLSAALDGAGLKVTLIHDGVRKADGNSYQLLPEAVRKHLSAETDAVHAPFVIRAALDQEPGANAVRDLRRGSISRARR